MARILIVEDELLIAEDLKYKLRSLGHTVVGQAMRGEDAVLKVEEVQPDVVLMDVRLRGTMSGLEAAERIREMNSTPVVLVTAHYSNLVSSRDLEQHPFLIIKPFTLDQINSVLQEACRLR